MSYERIGEGIMTMLVVLMCMVPLAIWKLIDIVIWLWTHVDIKWGAR